MHALIFWRNWNREYRTILFVVMATFIFSLCFMGFSWFRGEEAVIRWEKLQEQKVLETTVHTFQLGPFELQVPGESYVIFEFFNGGDFVPNTTASYIFLVVLTLSVAVLLAVVTTLERFWFFAAMSIFILFVASLKLEVLQLFGQRNFVPTAIVVVVFSALSYYYKSFNSGVRFHLRVVSFVGLIAAGALTIVFGAKVSFPMLHLAVTAYVPGLLFAFVFIIMIAHEIFASFVYIAGRSSGRNGRDFFIISLIWIANIFITYLHEIGSIHWNFVYINLYLLITISAILGFWGFRQRETLYEQIIPFQPFGAFLYLALGAIAFSFIGHALGNANDAALSVVRAIIIYSHLGFGIAFLLYFLSNFLGIMESNLSVYKVLYRPNRMPYFTFRLAGVILVITCIAYSNWREFVNQSMAGFYNSMGDLYGLLQDKDFYTETYYTQASVYAFGTHHSNYILGNRKTEALNFEDARYRYKVAGYKNPTDYALVNRGNTYIWETNVYGAISAYRETEQAVRTSGVIQNNLGFVYARAKMVDSTLYFLNEAREKPISKESAETNFFAFAALEGIKLNVDSTLLLFKASSPGTFANAIALSQRLQQPLAIPVDPLAHRRLNIYSATLLNNYIIRNAHTVDTAFVKSVDRIVSDPVNAGYAEAIKASLAFAYYHQGNVARALGILSELVFLSSNDKGKYSYIQGLWALEQGKPRNAAEYFSVALDFNYKKARMYKAIALTEAGHVDDALAAWDSVSEGKDDAEKLIAASIRQLLTMPATQASLLNDENRYQFCRYRIGVRDTLMFNALVNGFGNSNYKAQALLDMSRKLFEAGKTVPAIVYFNRISGLEFTDKRLYNDARFFELEMLASRREVYQLTEQINKGLVFDNSRTLEKVLYTAMLNEVSSDTVAAARNFAMVAYYNPYYEEGVIAAADYFRKHGDKNQKAYDILSEAIQINTKSVRLLRAYAAEAARVGLDDYAISAQQTIERLERE